VADRPTRSSAFDGALTPYSWDGKIGEDPLRFRERGALTLVHLQAVSPESISAALGCAPPAVNASRVHEDRTILGLAWDAWLIVESGVVPDVLLAPFAGLDASAVDVSHAWGVLRMSGGRAREALAKVCPVDLDPAAFKTGDCFQSALARHFALVHAVDDGPTFDLYVPRSFAVSFWDCLSDAAREFGYRVEA
jgi:sarcosine oxidase subunit gamma